MGHGDSIGLKSGYAEFGVTVGFKVVLSRIMITIPLKVIRLVMLSMESLLTTHQLPGKAKKDGTCEEPSSRLLMLVDVGEGKGLAWC